MPSSHMDLARRRFLGAATALFTGACGGPVREPVPPLTLTPLHTARLDELLPAVGVSWAILASPREIAQIPWLIPAIGDLAPEGNLDAFVLKNGFDLRQAPEAIWARYGDALYNADVEVIRHNAAPSLLESRFRARLATDKKRSQTREDIVLVSGRVGIVKHGCALIGPDVVAYQQGGDLGRGPARIATFYAEKKLDKTKTLLELDTLRALRERFGRAPFVFLAPGPFEGEWANAGRGLFRAATSVGLALRPTAREHIGLALSIMGDFRERGGEAEELLLASWKDIAASPLGGILGLDQPIEGPLGTHANDAIGLQIEVDPNRFASGLKALLNQDIKKLMQL